MCTFWPHIETACHYFLHCSNYTLQRETMREKIYITKIKIDHELLVAESLSLYFTISYAVYFCNLRSIYRYTIANVSILIKSVIFEAPRR